MSLIADWLAREGTWLLHWWLWISLAGLAALPLCWRLLAGLPDRGYSLARPLGLLLATLIFWLLGSGGFLANTNGGIAIAWLMLLAISATVFSRATEPINLRRWWRENRGHIALTELLFALLFFAWALYRAHQNDLTGTEKPMELAFLSAAQRSFSFPPADPWMAGYAISYYYMGYAMSAALSQLSGIGSAVGFNLTIASQFAMAGATAYGVAYNLVRSRASDRYVAPKRIASRSLASITGILALVMLVLLGNFQLPLVEAPYQSASASAEYLEFWGVQQRSNFAAGNYAPSADSALNWNTADWREPWWWWFRASRVLSDFDLAGRPTGIQPISEFPAFSFLLADNHPHVLALPFAVMSIGLMLNLLLKRRTPTRLETALYGLAIGGLAFLNSWDAPIYLAGLLGAEGLRRLMAAGKLSRGDWIACARFGASIAVVAGIAYLPYFISFRSQASGLLPNLAQPTYFPRFFIMFAPFIIILKCFLALESWRGRLARRFNWRLGLAVAGAVLLALLALMLILSAILAAAGQLNFAEVAAEDLFGLLLERRLWHGLTSIVLALGIALVVARLFPSLNRRDNIGEVAVSWIRYPAATGFALLLIGMGLCLTLLPEFVYLRDNFGARINTVFKFYYQAWALWSIAGAYAVYSLLADASLPKPHILLRALLALVIAVTLLIGLLYIVLGAHHRAWIETGRHSIAPPEPLTLDGGRDLLNADDRAVIECLAAQVGRDDAVIAEAVYASYDVNYGRAGAVAGIPILLGWENHERQWRGPTYAGIAGTRREDIDRLFTAPDFSDASPIIERYGISHIFYGSTERRLYGGFGEEKFRDFLPIVCETGESRIYFSGGL